MKYVMMLTDNGQHMPIIFPEALVHATMAMMAAAAIEVTVNSKATAISAGFVNIAGNDVTVHGESESMGGMKSNPLDAIRIMIGDSVAFMPNEMLTPLFGKLKESKVERICDCERGHNGIGLSGRICDCQDL